MISGVDRHGIPRVIDRVIEAVNWVSPPATAAGTPAETLALTIAWGSGAPPASPVVRGVAGNPAFKIQRAGLLLLLLFFCTLI